MVDVFGATRAPGSPHDTYQFDAQMTILDVSNSLDFVWQLEDRDGSLVLTTSFIINKDDFGIGSGFKGAAIKDEIEFEVSVLFSKEK